MRNSASDTHGRRTRLALTSLLLSLAPVMAIGLVRLISMGASSLPGAAVTVLSVMLYGGSLICSVGAMVTGWLALRRAQLPPSPLAVRVAAVAGVAIGIAGTELLVVGGVIVGLILHACSTNPANCG